MDSGRRIRVLVVDDSAFMRRVLHGIIATDPQLEVCGEARDGQDADVILISTGAEADYADLIAESPAAGFLAKSELSVRRISRILGDVPLHKAGKTLAQPHSDLPLGDRGVRQLPAIG